MTINFKKLLSITTGCFLALSIFAGKEPEIIEDESGELIGIRLNLPQELIDDCQDKFWALEDDTAKLKLDGVLCSQESLDEWCQIQTKINNKNPVELRGFLCEYAYILQGANKRKYTLDGTFCKRIELGKILGGIHLKGATPCCCCYYTEAENYIKILKLILLDCF